MKHRAIRGVCIGVDRHLAVGEPVPPDLTAAEVQFLSSIGAVERVPEEAALAVAEGALNQPEPAPAVDPETPAPAKSGKKEK